MEKMPLQVGLGMDAIAAPAATKSAVVAPGWRSALPVLSDDVVTLREIRPSDATSLFAMLTTDEVRRYMSPPPSDLRGFERFIDWAIAERAAGRYLCFAIVPAGYEVAIGILQVRQLDPSFTTAEWGIAIGSAFWGTGIFQASAQLVLDFVFDEIGVHRLEARAAVQNGRANGAARKLGAVPEGVLRRALRCRGQFHDQLMWSILDEDWRQARVEMRPMVH
jgi:ribosomal-protein-alanine N-acetyltransferase